jgi:hypothetical protein
LRRSRGVTSLYSSSDFGSKGCFSIPAILHYILL